MIRILSIIALAVMLISCNKERQRINFALEASGDNRYEIECLLNHYDKGSLKHKAAVYLVKNMPFHYSYNGTRLEIYRKRLQATDSIAMDINKVDSIWNNITETERAEIIKPHIKTITAEIIIGEIDDSFEIWENTPWKDSISFDTFLRYILPPTVANESVVGYRKELYNKYNYLIDGISGSKEAFDIIYTYLRDNFKLGKTGFPYDMDPIMLDNSRTGVCNDRSRFITHVMRALCIPAAYDFTYTWANYGGNTAGHSWVAYVGNSGDEIYTMHSYDSVSFKNGVIDGTMFTTTESFDDTNTPYVVDTMKKIAKIWRTRYEFIPRGRLNYKDNYILSFLSGKIEDVSEKYNYNGSIHLNLNKAPNTNLYLCTFRSGGGWIPVEYSLPRKKARFNNLGYNITYLPAYAESDEFIPLTNPVTILQDGSCLSRDPLTDDREKVILRRKYLLLSVWAPIRWKRYIGYTFEGSNDPDFAVVDTLHLVEDMPMGVTYADVNTDKPYRYLRVKPPYKTRPTMNEAAFFGTEENGNEIKIKGRVIYENIEEQNALQLFDGDYMTGNATKSNYSWVGYDIGRDNKIKVSKVMYLPWNDGNFVEPGDEYELFYYDMGWHSLGKQTAAKDYLIYDNVPKNAVLWLRDLTKGSEERIFTYENEKQVWW